MELVGHGYIYGAKGQVCSPAFRRQQAEQYPEQAHNILDVGAKWDGKPVWDCAQLTRTVAAAESVQLPSGATSQWSKYPWKRKGTIDTQPKGEVVFLYRRQNGSATVMSHTGVAIGDGTCIHARGTAYGVVRQGMSEHAWTHWASPWDGTEREDEQVNLTDKIFEVTGGRLALRESDNSGAAIMFWMPNGANVTVLEDRGEWCKVRYDKDGIPYMGYCMKKYLREVTDAPIDADTVTVVLQRADALRLMQALDKATAQG